MSCQATQLLRKTAALTGSLSTTARSFHSLEGLPQPTLPSQRADTRQQVRAQAEVEGFLDSINS